jgi:signal transduction histidine kinase
VGNPGSARRYLDAAADRLAADWQRFGADTVSADEVRSVTAEVAAWLDPGPVPTDGTVISPLHARVLASLRRELVLSPGAAAEGELLPLLVAIERVGAASDARWAERFRDRLDGPNGVELVVEIAHDLRSPLTSILFLAETMLQQRSGPITPLQERQIGLIYAAALGLSAVASDMVELVRGKDRLTAEGRFPFSFVEVLGAVEDIVRPIAEEKGLTLTLHPPAHDVRVGHPAALSRVLLNLTTNALKFTTTGGVEIRVREQEGDWVECAVIDTGRGIPAEALATLFEPFRRRQEPGNYAFSGSGLGLSICRKLVEAMGSELMVTTEPGVGTTFSCRLELPVQSEEFYFG